VIFFEPFEVGNMIITLVYNRILNDARSNDISPKLRDILNEQTRYVQSRIGKDKSDPIFKESDDKWFFTKDYFYELADKFNFSKCIIYSLWDSKTAFKDNINRNREVLEKSHKIKIDFPKWALEIIDEYDQAFSDVGKKDVLSEGCIIMTK